MNYNVNSGSKPTLGRRLKRVTDVNSMGYNPYDNQQPIPQQQDVPYWQPPPPSQPQSADPYAPPPAQFAPFAQPQTNTFFTQPMVQNMAMQYGQQLASTGRTMLQQEVDKYVVPVTSLKYYFAVDTQYVVRKLGLLFFPYTHRDWSIQYEQDGGPVQPRYEIHAPDLYIPSMAYATYVLVAALVLGMQQRFTPELIGILASSALAWCLLELALYASALYLGQIRTSLKTLDLLAYSGYKFVGIITSIAGSVVGGRLAYYACLAYCNLALAFFLMRTLKAQVLPEVNAQTPYYEVSSPTVTPPMAGNKRRLYFMLFIAGCQPVLSWWLSYDVIGYCLFTV